MDVFVKYFHFFFPISVAQVLDLIINTATYMNIKATIHYTLQFSSLWHTYSFFDVNKINSVLITVLKIVSPLKNLVTFCDIFKIEQEFLIYRLAALGRKMVPKHIPVKFLKLMNVTLFG